MTLKQFKITFVTRSLYPIQNLSQFKVYAEISLPNCALFKIQIPNPSINLISNIQRIQSVIKRPTDFLLILYILLKILSVVFYKILIYFYAYKQTKHLGVKIQLEFFIPPSGPVDILIITKSFQYTISALVLSLRKIQSQ